MFGVTADQSMAHGEVAPGFEEVERESERTSGGAES
jgi:hypothetical protein